MALLFVALTSAVGLGGGTAACFEEASGGKLPYVACMAVTLFLSGLVSLAEIIRLTAPILDIFYPAAIVIVLFIVLAPGLKGARAGAAPGTFLWIYSKVFTATRCSSRAGRPCSLPVISSLVQQQVSAG